MSKVENQLYYEEIGYNENNSKEIIIFIHSNLLSNWIWENQKTGFEDYHCIFLDIPHHGNSYFNNRFSIENSAETIKELIEEKTKDKENKTVHLVGIALGGQIILYILSKYPKLVNTAILSGINLNINSIGDSFNNINNNIINNNNKTTTNDNNEDKNSHNDEYGSDKTEEILDIMNQLKEDILDKKNPNFIIKGFLAEYGIGKEYFEKLKGSINTITNDNLISITRESLKFEIPILSQNTNTNVNSDTNEYNNNFNNDNKNNLGNIDEKNILVLYGTKEYPKVEKSAKIIKAKFNESQIFSIYKAIHLWNILDYKWFNEIVNEFIANKKLDLRNKPYLKRK